MLLVSFMRFLVTCWAQNNEMPRIVAVEYISRSPDGVQLEVFKMLSAGRAGKVGLLGQGALEVVGLLHVDGIEADVEEEAGED